MKILVFQAVENKRDSLSTFLKSRLVVVDETVEISEVLDLIKIYEYDAILLRMSENKTEEVELIRKLRHVQTRAPIVTIANSMSKAARLQILEAGADDLIINALSHEELFMKLQGFIRRSYGFQDNLLRVGSVEINMNAKKIFAKGKLVALTKKQYQIVEILTLRKGTVLSKEAILDHLYGGLDEPNPKIIDVFICKIRKKLQSIDIDNFIQTNWGSGYMVADRVPEDGEARDNSLAPFAAAASNCGISEPVADRVI